MTTVRSRQLLALLSSGRPASDPELKVALIGVASEIGARLASGSRESHDFFVSVATSIQEIRGTAHARIRADCLFDCCQYFYLSGTPLLALFPAREVVRLRELSGDKGALPRALNVLGIMCADTGSFGEAIEHYSAALQTARSMAADEAEAATWTNLGTVLIYMSRYHEALACLDRVQPTSSSGYFLSRKAAHNKSICHFNLGDFANARAFSEFALADDAPETSGELYSRVIRELHYIEVLLELGEFAHARQRLAHAATYGAKANTTRASIAVKLIEGLIDAYCGDSCRGISTLETLIASTSVTEIPPVAQDVLKALTRSYERTGQTEKALHSLQEILRVSRMHREESALAHIAIACGATLTDFKSKLDLADLHQRQSTLQAKLAERELVRAQVEVLERLAVTADLREEESGEHGFRVGRLSGLLAAEAGWDRDDSQALELAARLHDIGKIGIPDRILLSSGVLQESERKLMSAHAAIGAELLSKSNLGQLKIAEEIARCHHEWWDGTGYPRGLKGSRIPTHARIVALADVFDSLTHGRTYEKPWSMEAAIAQIERLRGKQFEPTLTDRFLALVRRMLEEHADIDQFLGRGSRASGVLQARDRIRSMLEGAESVRPARQFDLATSKS